MYPRFLYQIIINDKSYELLINKKLPNKILRKMIYFYPSISESYSWLHGDINEYRDPKDFLELRSGLDDVFINYFEKHVDKNDKILDLGCNSGRHLNALYHEKYKNLNGVDIMGSALSLFKLTFPETYKSTTIEKNFIQRKLINTDNIFYDSIYTIGATIELIHPSFDIIRHMCRVTKKHIILLIQPDAHNYPRFYSLEFARYGFDKITEMRLATNHCLFHFKRQ